MRRGVILAASLVGIAAAVAAYHAISAPSLEGTGDDDWDEFTNLNGFTGGSSLPAHTSAGASEVCSRALSFITAHGANAFFALGSDMEDDNWITVHHTGGFRSHHGEEK